MIAVNLKGTFNTCQAFVQAQREKQKEGVIDDVSIINVSSVVALQGNLGQTNYAASKGGVIGLTKAMAKEVAPFNVRVNAIAPGFITTPMTDAVPNVILQSILDTRIPMGRMGDPQDVANLVAFLASERSSYITGEIVECSGMISL